MAASAVRPMAWNTDRSAPRRATRAQSRSARSGSARCGTIPPACSASIVPTAIGRRWTSATTSPVTAPRPARRACPIISGVTSTAITRPPGPTAARSHGAAGAVPQPSSSTVMPVRRFASLTARSICAASFATRRSQSAALGPKYARMRRKSAWLIARGRHRANRYCGAGLRAGPLRPPESSPERPGARRSPPPTTRQARRGRCR